MNDIQKAIDEYNKALKALALELPESVYNDVKKRLELKSLLEQVAKEAFYAGELHEIWTEYPGFEDWWDEQNLTFKED